MCVTANRAVDHGVGAARYRWRKFRSPDRLYDTALGPEPLIADLNG
jgi:hypothetical protein